jgi:hypothetical protein
MSVDHREPVPDWQQAAEDVAATLGDEHRSQEVTDMLATSFRVSAEGTQEQRAHVQSLVIKMGEHGDDGPRWWLQEVKRYMGWA